MNEEKKKKDVKNKIAEMLELSADAFKLEPSH